VRVLQGGGRRKMERVEFEGSAIDGNDLSVTGIMQG